MPRGERPLETGDGLLVQFAGDLRRLRKIAGSPTYRQLSSRAHYSAAALSEAAGGRKLPSLAVTLAYVTACGGDANEWETRWRHTAAQLAASTTTEAEATSTEPDVRDDGPAPYVGLVAFQPDDADRFFGREALVTELVSQVREHRFLGVFGPSGCGKSSVLRAGLVAHLTAEHPSRNRARPAVVVFTPGRHPVEECAVHLAGLLGQSPADLRTGVAADPENLHLRVRQAMVAYPGEVDLVLVVDQFEELFTLCGEEQERDRFIDALVTAATAETSRTRVVLGVRADFYGHCAQHPRLVEALRDAQVMVGPMTADQLRQAITRPAERAGCRVETGLLTRIIADAAGQPGVLPLVSHALLETWGRRRGTTLSLIGYQTAGGIHHALAHTAEAVYTRLDNTQQDVAWQIFLRLTALGDGTEDTKRRVCRRELDTDNPDTTTVLDHLTSARLITQDHDSVELAHEALIRHWPRLRDWLAADRDGLRIHRDLTDATHAWQAVNRDPGALYRGTRLARAHDWATGRDRALTPHEREFLHTSLALRAREHAAAARRTRRLRRLVTLLAVLLLLAATATVYAVRAQQSVTEQRDRAIAENVLDKTDVLRATSPVFAAELALAAYRAAPTRKTQDGLLSAAATPLRNYVYAPAFRPDGRLVAISSDQPSTALWDVSLDTEPTVLGSLGDSVHFVDSAAFSQDGHLLAIGSDSRIQLWDITDLDTPVHLATFTSDNFPFPCPSAAATGDAAADLPRGDCLSLMFSPDGRTLVVSSPYKTRSRLWDLSNPRQPTELTTISTFPPAGNIYSVAFSADGDTLATVSSDTTARLWDISNLHQPTQLATLVGSFGDRNHFLFSPSYPVVYSPDSAPLAFSPHGQILATAGSDSTIRLWDVTNPRQPIELSTLEGHTAPVRSLAFTPDGQTLASAGPDRTIRLWDITNPRHPTERASLARHLEKIYKVTFSPDGGTLATADTDGTNLLWHATPERAASRVCELTRRVYRRLTNAEWDQYFPGLDYQPPCP